MTRQDRVYNETGALFLRQISRAPTDIDKIVSTLMKSLEGITFQKLKEDFNSFINDLEEFRFVVTGMTEQDLNDKDMEFSYANGSPINLIPDYSQETKEVVPDNTQDFFLEKNQGKPLISTLQFEL